MLSSLQSKQCEAILFGVLFVLFLVADFSLWQPMFCTTKPRHAPLGWVLDFLISRQLSMLAFCTWSVSDRGAENYRCVCPRVHACETDRQTDFSRGPRLCCFFFVPTPLSNNTSTTLAWWIVSNSQQQIFAFVFDDLHLNLNVNQLVCTSIFNAHNGRWMHETCFFGIPQKHSCCHLGRTSTMALVCMWQFTNSDTSFTIHGS